MYKIYYEYQKGYLDKTCNWNQETKKDVQPQTVCDFKLAKNICKKNMNIKLMSREEIRLEALWNFNPVLPAYQKIKNESVSELYNEFYKVTPEPVLFTCIPMTDEYNDKSSYILVVKFAQQPLFNKSNDMSDDNISKFIESLPIIFSQAIALEMKTRGQSSNHVWVLVRKGHITASNHHEMFIKMNTKVYRKSIIKPKTTPLIQKSVNGSKLSNIDAIKWGRDHEEDALKSFYIPEAMNHTDYKITHCGLLADKNKPYIAASPDWMFPCKCHKSYVIETKCPFKFRDKFIKNGSDDCDFLEILDGKIHFKKSHW